MSSGSIPIAARYSMMASSNPCWQTSASASPRWARLARFDPDYRTILCDRPIDLTLPRQNVAKH